jgi:formate hydrogenlyase subunit 3/multisubunit Na+/H+ antiporter MnhD subunit
MPPFGVFTSKFIIITTAINQQPWTIPFIFVALAVAFAAILGKVQAMVLGAGVLKNLKVKMSFSPFLVHMIIIIVLGVYMTDILKNWYHQAAHLITGNTQHEI